jgi:hypothetical protein
MRTQILIILLFSLSSHLSISQELGQLQVAKEVYDSIRSANKNAQLIFTRTANNKLIQVNQRNWPKAILTTYNIFVSQDRTLIIAVYPFSESGDWSREHRYYFDSTGRTFAYIHRLNSFNSICTEIMRQNTLFYYNQFSNELLKEYTITNKDGINLVDEDCIFNYPYEHQPYMNLEELKRKEKLEDW